MALKLSRRRTRPPTCPDLCLKPTVPFDITIAFGWDAGGPGLGAALRPAGMAANGAALDQVDLAAEPHPRFTRQPELPDALVSWIVAMRPHVFRPDYAPLFTEEERGVARAQLKEYGYPV